MFMFACWATGLSTLLVAYLVATWESWCQIQRYRWTEDPSGLELHNAIQDSRVSAVADSAITRTINA